MRAQEMGGCVCVPTRGEEKCREERGYQERKLRERENGPSRIVIVDGDGDATKIRLNTRCNMTMN